MPQDHSHDKPSPPGRSRANLSDGDELFQLVQRLAGLGSWTWSLVEDEVEWSAELYRIYGLEPGGYDRSFEGYLRCIHADDRARVAQTIQSVLASGERFIFEARIARPDGELRTVESVGQVVRDEHDKPLKVVAACMDVTDRHAAAYQLEGERNLLDGILNAVDSLVLVGDLSGALRRVNSAVVARTGRSYQQLLKLRFADVVGLRGEPQRRREFESDVSGPMGNRRISWVVRRLTLTVAQEEELFMATGVDVTDRRELQAQLRISDRMATIGTLAAGVAHELNNPLTYVSAAAEQLQARLLGESAEVDELLRELVHGVSRMSSVVRDLSAFSRGPDDSREQAEELEVVSLSPLVRSALGFASHEIRHRAQVETKLDEGLRVKLEQSRLVQVLVNLLSNAAHAIEPGAAASNLIRVVTQREGKSALILIEDTGVGIDPAILTQVFDPFFTTKKIDKNTGLGLYVCHRIVTELGGDIAIEPLERGTRVKLKLPAVDSPSDVKAAPDANAEKEPPLRILLIDDEPLVLRALRLVMRGHDVDPVNSGKEALEKLARGNRYDVVLCDMMMPEMMGTEVYRHIQSTYPQLERRFCFLSGGAYTEEARRFADANPERVLEKPIGRASLERTIRKLANRKR